MMSSLAPMASTILDAAERITQTVGYNGLSFRDVAAAVGIKSASVHYHFPTKGKLGAILARRYTDRLIGQLDQIDIAGGGATAAFDAYLAGIQSALEQDGRMCLGGILAAEADAVPDEVRAEVRRFIALNVSWLSRVIGAATGAPPEDATVQSQARAVFAALEGAMLIARGTGDAASFSDMAAQFRRAGLIPA